MKSVSLTERIALAMLVSLLVLVPTVSSAQPGVRTSNGASKQAPGAPQEGIKVHGHWTITVKNPDGSISSRHEFENSLQQTAPLASILSRTVTTGSWQVLLDKAPGSTNQSPCQTFPGAPTYCAIIEPNGAEQAATSQQWLNLTVQLAGSTVVLGGTITSQLGGEIGNVTTLLGTCEATATLADCATRRQPVALVNFTAHTLTSPIILQPGQIAQISVVISFS